MNLHSFVSFGLFLPTVWHIFSYYHKHDKRLINTQLLHYCGVIIYSPVYTWSVRFPPCVVKTRWSTQLNNNNTNEITSLYLDDRDMWLTMTTSMIL
jgi:hypothetical protein